jgi:DNA replication and repair protein RecF
MQLSQVDIQWVRNLKSVRLLPASGINLIYGNNASGKTSLLEAIYLLSHGRSFRTSNIRSVINSKSSKLQVFGKVKQEISGSSINLGLEKGPTYTQIRINQQSVTQTSRLAAYLPVQIINPEAHRLLEQGPSQRRKFIDWGLFHVEPSFHEIWQKYTRILKQRNAALRERKPGNDAKVWDKSLVEAAEGLTELRNHYIQELIPFLQDYTNRLIQITPTVQYRQGWPQDTSFESALSGAFELDTLKGFTRYGPHRADLLLSDQGQPVQEQFSRGQQKLLVSAMRLAQITHLRTRQQQQSVVLVDDLAAELDQIHRGRLIDLLVETGAQLFITSTDSELFKSKAWASSKMFHVEHGQVSEVI